MTRRVVIGCIAMLLSAADRAQSQVVPVKTSSLAQGDQFSFLPSANRGMAGVSIAIHDTLLDPFANPAAGARLLHTYAFGAPSFYALSRNGSAGSTFPIGVMTRRGPLFAVGVAAVQVVEPPGGSDVVFNPVALSSSSDVISFPPTAAPRSRTNRFLFGSVGRTLGDSTLAVAASAQWSRMQGIDGVDLLYPGSIDLRERGDNLDLRFGAVKQWSAGRTLETTALHERNSTRHDVSYMDFIWDPGTRSPIANPHVDRNFDRRHVWGLHVTYEQPLRDTLWRVGALLTANHTAQPTTPTFGVMNPAGDPGRSSALDAGIGVARIMGRTLAAVDAIYEPIAAERRDPGSDAPDRYRFSNGIVRGGASHEFRVAPTTTLGVQAGVQLHRIRYTLDAAGGVDAAARSSAAWNEWTHGWSATLRSSRVDFRYEWRMLSGVQRPGFGPPPPIVLDSQASFAPGFPPMQMLPVRVTTQQFSFSVRLP